MSNNQIDWMGALCSISLPVVLYVTIGKQAIIAICDAPPPRSGLTEAQIKQIISPSNECFLCHLPG